MVFPGRFYHIRRGLPRHGGVPGSRPRSIPRDGQFKWGNRFPAYFWCPIFAVSGKNRVPMFKTWPIIGSSGCNRAPHCCQLVELCSTVGGKKWCLLIGGNYALYQWEKWCPKGHIKAIRGPHLPLGPQFGDHGKIPFLSLLLLISHQNILHLMLPPLCIAFPKTVSYCQILQKVLQSGSGAVQFEIKII